jgi:hypothetical protein
MRLKLSRSSRNWPGRRKETRAEKIPRRQPAGRVDDLLQGLERYAPEGERHQRAHDGAGGQQREDHRQRSPQPQPVQQPQVHAQQRHPHHNQARDEENQQHHQRKQKRKPHAAAPALHHPFFTAL